MNLHITYSHLFNYYKFKSIYILHIYIYLHITYLHIRYLHMFTYYIFTYYIFTFIYILHIYFIYILHIYIYLHSYILYTTSSAYRQSPLTLLVIWPASWSRCQCLWLLFMRTRDRFPVIPWEFSLAGEDPRGGHELGS
jgi:hypothetical protein